MLVGPKQTRPNKHTMNVLLMNQLLARRLDEARNTIEIIVANHANLVRMKGKVRGGGLRGPESVPVSVVVFDILSRFFEW